MRFDFLFGVFSNPASHRGDGFSLFVHYTFWALNSRIDLSSKFKIFKKVILPAGQRIGYDLHAHNTERNTVASES